MTNFHRLSRAGSFGIDSRGIRAAVAAVLLLSSLVAIATANAASANAPTNYWTQTGPDHTGGGPGDYLGENVAISADGSTVAMAGIYIDLVRIIRVDGSGWSQLGSDIVSEWNVFTGSSLALSADGNTVLIGADGYREPTNIPGDPDWKGRAQVFSFDGSDWVQLGSDIIGASGENVGAGGAMSADGRTIIVGGGQRGPVGGIGVARIYSFDGTDWALVGNEIEGLSAYDGTGDSLAMNADGTIVAVGSPRAHASWFSEGRTRVFSFDGTDWVPMGAPIDGTITQGWFGESVALAADGLTVAVGSPGPGYDFPQYAVGYASVWAWSGTGWEQVGTDILGEAGTDGFGRAVDISSDGTVVSVGADPIRDAEDPGYAKTYRRASSGWVQVGQTENALPANQSSVRSVAISGDATRLVIGTPEISTAGTNSGRIRIFEAASCNGLAATIYMPDGASGVGTAGDDVIIGTSGADRISGLGGNDTICGGAGVDRLVGGAGNDVIFGEGGSDRIYGQSGDDTITAGSGADRVWGGAGNDVISGGGGQDRLRGGGGDDVIQGNHSSDTIFGESGNDVIRGAKGKDVLSGGNDQDELYGGDNSDTLDGGFGVDLLDGQRGRDTCTDPNGSGTTITRC